MPPLTLHDVTHSLASLSPTALALVVPSSPSEPSQVLTYASLSAAVKRVSETLVKEGVGRGDFVCLVIDNSIEFVITFLAITCVRAIAAPLDPTLKTSQFEYYFNDIHPKIVVVTPRSSQDSISATRNHSIPLLSVHADDKAFSISTPSEKTSFLFAETSHIPDSSAPPQGNDLCLFLHTSGTTGKPKGVPLSHVNLLTSMHNISSTYSLSPADRTFLVMPLFHVHGLIGALLSTLYSRGTAVIQWSKFSATTFWPQLNESRCTWYTAVPTIHQILLGRAKTDFTSKGSLRFIRSCSASLSPATLVDMERIFGVPVVEAYAMSEAAHQMTSNALPPGKRKAGSVGAGRGVEITIKNADGVTLPQGEKGEVCIRGRNVMKGYHNNEEANKANFTSDGWFRTGDQGYLDDDAYVVLTGRLKEMINRGGEKISPIVIDDVILSHPAVSLAVTFGVPDPKYGEEVHAAVVLYPEYSKKGKEDIEAVLKEHCAKHLAAFSVPKRFYIVEDVPRTSTGKIQRRIVASHFATPQAKL